MTSISKYQDGIYFVTEQNRIIPVSQPLSNRFKLKENFGWWLACVQVSKGVFSPPKLYGLASYNDTLYKWVSCSVAIKMAKKEEFLAMVQRLFQASLTT